MDGTGDEKLDGNDRSEDWRTEERKRIECSRTIRESSMKDPSVVCITIGNSCVLIPYRRK